MTDKEQKLDPYLLQLVLSLQAGAMQQMGKMVSPISGEIERNLEMARNSIDILDMLEKKMQSNLTAEETKLIGHALYELRLNYVDEAKKEAEQPADENDGDEQKPVNDEDKK
jgi:hypothetical protein